MSSVDTAYHAGVASAYWLFSHANMTGRSHIAARFMDSWTIPWLVAPSPKNATPMDSFSFLRYFAVRAAPTASGTLAPTIAFAPSIPFEKSAMCIEPPFPLHCPVCLPMISAIMCLVSSPFAMQCPCPL